MVIALSTAQGILVGIAAGAGVVILLWALASGVRRPGGVRGPDIPSAMRSAPSDEDLEVPIREKLYVWGLITVLIMAVWVPVLFLRENTTNKEDTAGLLATSVERGHLTTLPGNEENQIGFNCERCHGPGLHGGQNVYNSSVVVVPNLQTVCGGAGFGHPLITDLQDVINTIAQGRTGTDMPSWSVRYSGAMDDQQIQDLVNYILSIQKVPESQNICLHAPSAPSASPSPSSSP